MDAQVLKDKIKQDDKVRTILEALGCKNVKRNNTCYTASNPDGDNSTAINVFHDTLKVLNHTRNDFPEKADIIELVIYIKKLYITHAINWICEICGYSFYDSPYQKEVIEDPCVAILDILEDKGEDYDNHPLLFLPEAILNEYVNQPNVWFLEEGIDLETQKLFEIGYSIKDDCITIPIRDELGNLVGVKGRRVFESEFLPKYWYLHPVPKTRILYGLDKAFQFIKESGKVLVFESEKSVEKAFSMGYCNSVSIGGHEISDTQVLKLEKLGADIIFALDKDIGVNDIKKQANKFLIKDRLYAIVPNKHKDLLHEKDAPVDKGLDIFNKLLSEDLYKIPV